LLAQELRAKGIDPEIMSEALDESGIDELTDALTIARMRDRQLSGLEPAVRERRLSGFLARRGYGYDVIRQTLNTLREEAGLPE
jgi:regulatory protein